MAWIKSGVINDITYDNSTSSITSLNVFHIPGSSGWLLRVNTMTALDYERLKEALRMAGFIPPIIEYRPAQQQIRFDSSSTAATVNFMNVIKSMAADFDEIQPDISSQLHLNMAQNVVNPHWFPEIIGRGDCYYRTADPCSTISEIHLFKMIPRHVITIKTNTEVDSQVLKAALLVAGLSSQVLGHAVTQNKLVFNSDSIPLIVKFMRVVKSLTLNFEEIEPQISQWLDIDLNQTYSMPSFESAVPSRHSNAPISSSTRAELLRGVNALASLQPARGRHLVPPNSRQAILPARANVPIPLIRDMDEEALLSNGMFDDDEADVAALVSSISESTRTTDPIRMRMDEGDNRTTQRENVMWTREGDFLQRRNDPRIPLVQYCSYFNSSPHAIILKLDLCGYRDGSFQVGVNAASLGAFDQLNEALIRVGFPVTDAFNRSRKKIFLKTIDRNMISCFLNVMKAEEPAFATIETELCACIGIDLNTPMVMSTWNRSGSFTEVTNQPGVPLNRQIKYTTGNSESLITEFKLYGYNDGDYIFATKFSSVLGFEELRQAVQSLGLPVCVDDFAFLDKEMKLRFNASTRENFNQFIGLLCEHSPHFASHAEAFTQHVMPVITASEHTAPSMRLFGRATTIASQAMPNNEKKLEDIGFSDNDFTSEEEK